LFSALHEFYDDARRAELARKAQLSQRATHLAPIRTWPGFLIFLRTLSSHTKRRGVSLPPVDLRPSRLAARDEPMTRERVTMDESPV